MELHYQNETRLLSEQERLSPTVKTVTPKSSEKDKPVIKSRNRDVPPMTMKSVVAMASALLLAGTLLIFALVRPGHSLSLENRRDAASPLVVQTPAGKIIGSRVSKDNYAYMAYRSIPFAKPPLGDLRFKRPQPLEPPPTQESVINSNDYKPSCWSITKTWPDPHYGEDCLYLNIYTPHNSTMTQGHRLPVLMWIHGGGFVAGSTFPEPGKMVIQGNVIVVSVNYRLGVFGFLTNLDDDLPSNNGLWDQYMAIKWVHENIEYFHGDSSSITVIGESAGAVSVGLHSLSPITSEHFHKAILQSGAMTGFVSRFPQTYAAQFANLAGCPAASNSTLLINCLQGASVQTILSYSKPEYYITNIGQRQFDFVWTPVIDGEFVVDEPLRLLNNVTYLQENGVFDKDFLIGVLNDEGALIASNNFLNPLYLNEIANATFFNDLVDALLATRYGADLTGSRDVTTSVNVFYTGQLNITHPPAPISVLDLAADVLFVIPATEAAIAISDRPANTKGKTFFYNFDFCPPKPSEEAPCLGHGEDVVFQFPRSNFSDPVLAQLSDQYISILTGFASTSNPGWSEFKPDKRKYYRISPSSDSRSHLYNYRVQLWLETVPRLLKQGKQP